MKKIAIIGGGNMGGAIAKGIVKAGLVKASEITVTRRHAASLEEWSSLGYNTSTDNKKAVEGADIVIAAVKPYQTEGVLKEISGATEKGVCLISVATGVSVAQLEEWFGAGRPVIRVMPNTAAEVGESLTAIVGGSSATAENIKEAQDLFSAIGKAYVVTESQMPAITALASCGIAHALRYIRAAMESGIEMGLTSKMSAEIVSQTVKGAAELILKNGSHPEVEIDKVCTPAGVTITGINEMEHAGFTSAVMKGMMGSYNKIVK